MLENERRRMSIGSEQTLDVEDGVMNMKEYISLRQDGLEQWESREGELLNQLKNTVTKTSQLKSKLRNKTRGKSELINETQFDKIDLLNVNINDIVNTNLNPDLHKSDWRD